MPGEGPADDGPAAPAPAPATRTTAEAPGKARASAADTQGKPQVAQTTQAAKTEKPAQPQPVPTAPLGRPLAPDHFPGVTLLHAAMLTETADGVAIVDLDRDDLFLAASSLRDQGFRLLSCLSASDDKKGPMHVFYAFVKPAGRPADFAEARLRVTVPKIDADGKPIATTCPSITDVYPAANWHERENYDMYGIVFEGHPDLRRMFLPEGWKGYPMRKDYSEPEQYVAMADGEDIVLSVNEEGSW